MSIRRKRTPPQVPPPEDAVFDRAHLRHYTMESLELEREIINLFVGQLPATLTMIAQADSAASWKLATHTLKGSAAAVGARRINQIAIDLEEAGFNLDVNVKKKLVTALEKAVADFRAMTVRIYSSP